MAYQWPPACYVLPYILGKHGPMSLRKTLILLDWCPTQMTSFTRPDSRMRPSLPMAKTETVGALQADPDRPPYRAGTLCECYDELGNRYQLPVYCLSPPVNLLLEHTEEESLEPPEPTPGVRREFPLKVRLSTGKDVRLNASLPDTVGQLKRQLHSLEGIEPSWQRWFFSGKLLTDRTRLQETKIQKDFVIQVIINQPPPPQD